MGDIMVVICFAGTIACLGLALWVWRRGSPSRPAAYSDDPGCASVEPNTEQIAVTYATAKTEVFMQTEILANPTHGVVANRQVVKPDNTTAYLSREEIIAAAERRAAPDTTATEHLSRDEILAFAKQTGASGHDDSCHDLLTSENFAPHFDEALEAMLGMLDELAGESTNLHTLAHGPERIWRSHIDVLSLAARRVTDELALPKLRNPETSPRERLATALLLLEFKGGETTRLCVGLAAELDATGHDALLGALAYCDDERVETIVTRGLEQAPPERRLAWLQLHAERGLAPDESTLVSLLGSADPDELALGLQLLPWASARDNHGSTIDRHALAGPPHVCEAAIITGLVLGRPAAQLSIKQASRQPTMATICALHAALGSSADIMALISWAQTPGAPAHAAWALGWSGRVEALDACVAKLDDGNGEVVRQAVAGFRVGTGYDGNPMQIETWWSRHRSRFKSGLRYLGGEPASIVAVKRQMSAAPTKLRQALALELFVRSHGAIRLPLRRLPSAHLRALEQLDAVDIEIGAPQPGRPSA